MTADDPSTEPQSPDPSTEPSLRYDPKYRCVAKSSKTGRRCLNRAAKGGKVCHYHGGHAPQVQIAAGRRVIEGKAQLAVDTLGLPVDGISPHDALLEEVARTAGAVRWLEARIRLLDPDLLTWDVSVRVTGRQAWGQADYSEHRAQPHPLWTVYQGERKHLVDVCRVTIAAGVEERYVALAEHLGGLFADAMNAVLDDIALTEEQAAAARESIPRQLRMLSGGIA